MNFEDLKIKEFGHSIHMVGMIYRDERDDESEDMCLYLPGKKGPISGKAISMTVDNWHEINRQLDFLETEIFTKDEDGKLLKLLVRKSQRQISQNVMWECFRRDDFKCRYCGADAVPLTTDHLVLWEEMGESTKENMLTCCKKCNQTRGNMRYEAWLKSKYYLHVSLQITSSIRAANEELVFTLPDLPRRLHKRGKR